MTIKKSIYGFLLLLAVLTGGLFIFHTVFAENETLTLSADTTTLPDYGEGVVAVTVTFNGRSIGAVSGSLAYDGKLASFISAEGYGEEGFQFTTEDDGSNVKFVWGDAAEKAGGSELMVFYFSPLDETAELPFSFNKDSLTACRAENDKVVYFTIKPGNAIAEVYVEKAVMTDAVYDEEADSVLVSWEAVNGADGYHVFRKMTGGEWEQIGETTEASFADENPLFGQVAEYTAAAYVLDSKGVAWEGEYEDPGKTVDLNLLRFYEVRAEECIYTGEALTPAFTVVNADDGSVLDEAYYTAEFADNVEIGTGTITITGKKQYSGTITGTFVIDGGPIKAISLAETSITMVYGDERTMPEVIYEPDYTSDEKTVTWSTSDDSVLGILYGGLYGMKPGKAVLTAEVPERELSASADVRVLFSDVTDANLWYYEPVYWALDNDVTSGYGPGTFQPMAGLTRGQTVTFLYRLAGSPDVSGLSAQEFSDVSTDDWFYAAVKWAAANGITSGYGPGTFQPYKTCTRAMIVTFLMQYAKYAGFYEEPAESSNFTDVAEDAWYKASVDWAVANGITSGYGLGTFQPGVTCTRAMMVTFLKKTDEVSKVE